MSTNQTLTSMYYGKSSKARISRFLQNQRIKPYRREIEQSSSTKNSWDFNRTAITPIGLAYFASHSLLTFLNQMVLLYYLLLREKNNFPRASKLAGPEGTNNPCVVNSLSIMGDFQKVITIPRSGRSHHLRQRICELDWITTTLSPHWLWPNLLMRITI